MPTAWSAPPSSLVRVYCAGPPRRATNVAQQMKAELDLDSSEEALRQWRRGYFGLLTSFVPQSKPQTIPPAASSAAGGLGVDQLCCLADCLLSSKLACIARSVVVCFGFLTTFVPQP